MQKARSKMEELKEERQVITNNPDKLLLNARDLRKVQWIIWKYRALMTLIIVALGSGIGNLYVRYNKKIYRIIHMQSPNDIRVVSTEFLPDGGPVRLESYNLYTDVGKPIDTRISNEQNSNHVHVQEVDDLMRAYLIALNEVETEVHKKDQAYMHGDELELLYAPIKSLKRILSATGMNFARIKFNSDPKQAEKEKPITTTFYFDLDHDVNKMIFDTRDRVISLRQTPGGKISTSEITRLYQLAYYALLASHENMGSQAYDQLYDLLQKHQGKVHVLDFEVTSFLYLLKLLNILSDGQLEEAVENSPTPEEALKRCAEILEKLLQEKNEGVNWLAYLAAQPHSDQGIEAIKKALMVRALANGFKLVIFNRSEGRLYHLEGTPIHYQAQ